MNVRTPVLEVRNLRKVFQIPGPLWRKRQDLVAVHDVSFVLPQGKTIGIVGESGSGKSTVANMIMGLLEPTSGEVLIDGTPVRTHERSLHERQRVQMVFQDPYSSLNPRMTVGDIIAEPLKASRTSRRAGIDRRVDELLDMVKLPHGVKSRYPHEFSGGQRQRVVIARALALEPQVLICDEAVSALDVSVQGQVLNLLRDLQDDLGLSYIFIGHGLDSVYFMSDEVAVMYLGRVVERIPSEKLYAHAGHPYTRALLEVAATRTPFSEGGAPVLQGEIPSPLHPPSGCVFRTRCPIAIDACALEVPLLTSRGEDHTAACIRLTDPRKELI